MDGGAPLVAIANGQDVAFPGHDSGESDIRELHQLLREFDRGFARLDTGPVHAGVDLDHHAGLRTSLDRRIADEPGALDAVHGAHDVDFGGELRQAAGLDRTDDLVGDEDVADAAGGVDLGLGEFGAGNADGARRDQAVCDGWRLVGLGMGSPGNLPLGQQAGDRRDVGIEDIEVHDEGGGVERFDG